MKKAIDMPMHGKSKGSTNKSLPLQAVISEYNDDVFTHERLGELEVRCDELNKANLGNDADYAIKVIKKICMEIDLMKLKIVSDRPRPGWYAFDGQLLRDVASIVFKMELLAAKYFAESYKRYTYISSANSCNSKEKIYELADEWLSDRRTMIEVVSAMLGEIQDLGITPNPVLLKKPETGDSLLDILDDLLPGRGAR